MPSYRPHQQGGQQENPRGGVGPAAIRPFFIAEAREGQTSDAWLVLFILNLDRGLEL